jgi:subtilisin family serine protease
MFLPESRHRRKGISPPLQSRLQVEQLEDRALLSASGLADLEPLAGATDSTEPVRVLVRYQADPDGWQTQTVAAADLDATLEALRADPTVLDAEPDYVVHQAGQLVPNDPQFGNLWGLNNTGQSGGTADADIDAPEAWTITTGSVSTVVAVIDTGIDYTHPDLYLNVWINQGEIPTAVRSTLVDSDSDGIITFRDLNNPVNAGKVADSNHNGYIDGKDILAAWSNGNDQDGNGYKDDLVGWDFINNDNDPFDDNGHGTHVSGTIGGLGNNGVGVAGINWSVSLMALKFLGANGSGYISDAVAALNYAVANGASVSNNSWSGGGYTQTMANALAAARSAGHIFVAAAGNDGLNSDVSTNYPSGYNLDNVIAVAATDRKDHLASFSNYGATSVDLAAPGVSIRSTVPGGYATYNGTSMATPHVTGVVALLRTLHPNWSYRQILDQILGTTDPVSGLQGKVATGGRLNAYRALSSGAVPPVVPPPAPQAAPPAPAPAPHTRSFYAVASDAGVPSLILVYDGATGAQIGALSPYGGFTGGIRIALGDVNGDGYTDIVVGAGPGAPGGHLKVFSGRDLSEMASFMSYPGFTGGISVAVGDIDGDGYGDIITGAGPGAPGGHLKVFSGRTFQELMSVMSYPGFTGGINVAAGDINGDGYADIITGAGPGAPGGHLKVFSGRDQSLMLSLMAYPGFTGGINVAAGDINGDGRADIITGASSLAAHVKVFDGASRQEEASFFAYGAPVGVRVGVTDRDGDGRADIITAPAAVAPHVRIFSGATLSQLDSFFALVPVLQGGLFVAGVP